MQQRATVSGWGWMGWVSLGGMWYKAPFHVVIMQCKKETTGC